MSSAIRPMSATQIPQQNQTVLRMLRMLRLWDGEMQAAARATPKFA